MKNLNFLSKAFVAIVAMLSIGLSALAHDFEVNGIYYNYLDKTAKTIEVTYKGDYSSEYSNEYTGAVTIPSSVTYSGTTYSVTKIRNEAFIWCDGLTSITIPNSVTEIGYYAFEYCYGLTEVNITDLSAWCKIDFGNYSANPLCYAQHLFLNGEEIKNLVIPNDITQIKSDAFKRCTGLTSVTIPNSVIYIGDYAFDECYGLTEVNITDLSAWCKIDFGDYYANPLYYAKKLKLNGTVITNLVIPNDITQIKKYAFYGCTSLTSVTIPNSVTEIGYGAFLVYSGLTEVNISDLSAWCKIDFGNSGSNPLYQANKLKLNGVEITNLVIPNDITQIKDYAFYGCTGLTSVTIPNSVTSIGDGAFSECSGLTSVTIPNSVTSIGDYAFEGCSGLTSVTIPNSVTSIGDGAFEGCSGLTSVTIGNSVTKIGNYAFNGCTGLKELIIEDGTETLSLGYNGYYYYTGEGLFYDCPIEKLYLGRNLSYNTGYEYGYSPFYNCDELTSVTIGNSVTEIGDDAFYDCYLKSVTSYCMTPPRCYHDAFGGSYSAILKVPEGTKDLYANATVWEDFYNIQEIAGVEDVLIDNVVVKIAVENGNISINGIENPHIEIYNINGKCIYSGNDTTIPVSDTGVYILRINGKSYKIVNK